MEGAKQTSQLRPLRVKSVRPPQKKELLPTEWLVPTFGVLCVALLQLPGASDFWRNLADALGGERLATVLLISVIPNLLVYYPNSFFYLFIDFFGQDWSWVREKKIQPVRIHAPHDARSTSRARTMTLSFIHRPHSDRPSNST